ncbi:hypothetical protein SNEBB_010459 [Seison nebaliae]|nr:hypothetical protein SNEBB_010459 [Seison nebaliae]
MFGIVLLISVSPIFCQTSSLLSYNDKFSFDYEKQNFGICRLAKQESDVFKVMLDPNSISNDRRLLNIGNIRDYLRPNFLSSTNETLNFYTISYDPCKPDEQIVEDVISQEILQLCKGKFVGSASAFNFLTTVKQTCSLPMDVLKRMSTKIRKLYLAHPTNKREDYLVRICITQNQDVNDDQCSLTNSFIMLDNMNHVEGANQAIFYPSTIKLVVEVDGGQANRPIGIMMNLTHSLFENKKNVSNKKLDITFEIEYITKDSNMIVTFMTIIGVFTIIIMVIAGFEAFAVYNRQSMFANVDCYVFLKFLLSFFNLFADLIFVCLTATSIYILLIFKNQYKFTFFLPERTEKILFDILIIICFAFKTIHIIHMLTHQVLVDIFFIDWENPKLRSMTAKEQNDELTYKDRQVSAWRTYLVANEWNEIQVCRKTNLPIQLIFSLFFLSVIELERIALEDRYSTNRYLPNILRGPTNSLLRHAIFSLIYIFGGLLQIILHKFIFQRLIHDKMGAFIDLCSMANISVFILSFRRYGFYIHGRSPHGEADVSIRQLVEFLEKEQKDLSGNRGLLPKSSQQTFVIRITEKFRRQYDRIASTVRENANIMKTNRRSGDTGIRSEKKHKALNVTSQAYCLLTAFLTKYVNRSLKDFDYHGPIDKSLFENIFNIEMQTRLSQGTFYNDNGHSFDEVLWYGNERNLFIWNMITFALTDWFYHNFVLSAIITLISNEIFKVIRRDIGKRNLVNKTLIDRRFLI